MRMVSIPHEICKTGNLIFCSGCIALNPSTGSLMGAGDAMAEARQSLANLGSLVEASGSSMDRVVKATIFLQDMADFHRVNEVFARAFQGSSPARSCVQVAALPLGAKVQIEAVLWKIRPKP